MVRRAHAVSPFATRVKPRLFYTRLSSPVGALLLTASPATGALTRLHFGPGQPEADWMEEPAVFAAASAQLTDYFEGKLTRFTLTLAPQGSEFQLAVWRQMLDIPYGSTISYGELARRLGDPGAARAVGLAAGANPLAIVIPCHRVIGASGKLTGFGGGLVIKARLLGLERSERELEFPPPAAAE